ncbi:MAG: hypothetical protein RL154_1428 [Pseudomonadota bacterium]|jgi:hypothetical protein
MNKKIFIFLLVLTNIASFAEVHRNDTTNEVLTDNGLVWQDVKLNATQKQSYKMAIGYCHQLAIKTKQNWHIPDKNEIEEIIDTSKVPSINSTFRYCANDGYWLDGKLPSGSVSWIDFNDGVVYYGSGFDRRLYVRCVRNTK